MVECPHLIEFKHVDLVSFIFLSYADKSEILILSFDLIMNYVLLYVLCPLNFTWMFGTTDHIFHLNEGEPY